MQTLHKDNRLPVSLIFTTVRATGPLTTCKKMFVLKPNPGSGVVYPYINSVSLSQMDRQLVISLRACLSDYSIP